MWPEIGSNHTGDKPNGLRVCSLIHQATWGGGGGGGGALAPAKAVFEFQINQNGPYDPKGNKATTCTMVKYGETFYDRHMVKTKSTWFPLCTSDL